VPGFALLNPAYGLLGAVLGIALLNPAYAIDFSAVKNHAE
jgi:hypothetical protein